MGVGVLDGTKANSAPNLVGVGAGAELGNFKFIEMEQKSLQKHVLASVARYSDIARYTTIIVKTQP